MAEEHLNGEFTPESESDSGSGSRMHQINTFALESPAAATRRVARDGVDRVTPPSQKIDRGRETAKDPHAGRALDHLVNHIMGEGYSIHGRNIPYTDAELTQENVALVKQMLEGHGVEDILLKWLKMCMTDGMSFLEINWQDGRIFKPRVLPTKDVSPLYNQYGEISGYEIKDKSGGGPKKVGKYDVAHLSCFRYPSEDWPEPLMLRAFDQAEMVRDMEIDMARFVASKAYPPIIWKLGTDDRDWSTNEIQDWRESLEGINPDSMFVAPGDVETETVGVSGAAGEGGNLNMTPVFDHLQKREATALGVPYMILNGESEQQQAVTQMPAFDRWIKRWRQRVQNAVEQQILRSLLYHPNPEAAEDRLVPRFEFEIHSSEEERLQIKTLLKLFRHGFLTREAFADRAGIDPEKEMPSPDEIASEIKPVMEALGLLGEADGGRPEETDAAERTATTRQNPERSVDDDSRDGRSVSDSPSS